jgi:hypothetical protein
MDEQAVRALARQAIARHLQSPNPRLDEAASVRLVRMTDASHARYVLPETDGPCLIEPAVQCNHCGYCQSHGH